MPSKHELTRPAAKRRAASNGSNGAVRVDEAAQLVEPGKLKPWVRNPRRNDAAVDKVAASIERFGFGAPIVARKANGEIIAGHTRHKAALKLGLAQVPVRYVDVSAKDAHRLALADNKLGEIAEWDDSTLLDLLKGESGDELLAMGFDLASIDDLAATVHVDEHERSKPGEAEPEHPEDDEQPAQVETRTTSGEVIEIGRHKLACGDCVAVLKSLSDVSVDAVVTDPPYFIGFMGREWDSPGDTLAERFGKRGGWDAQAKGGLAIYESHLAWSREALRVLKPGGHLLAFAATRTQHRLACALEDVGFELRDVIEWCQWQGFPKSLDVSKALDDAIESRYGTARCDCLDGRDGPLDWHRIGCGRGQALGASGGSSQIPTFEARTADVSIDPSAGRDPVCKLRESGAQEAEGSAEVEEAVLLARMRKCGAEEARFGDASIRVGMEEPSCRGSSSGQRMPSVRTNSKGERVSVARSSSGAVSLWRDKPAGESSRVVRPLSPRDRGGDGSCSGIDPHRCSPRRTHLDSDGRSTTAVARICSWCGLPDREWLRTCRSIGTALKPSHEPIVLARKPLVGTVAENVLKYGVGGLNIDGCRYPYGDASWPGPGDVLDYGEHTGRASGEGSGCGAEITGLRGGAPRASSEQGRFPANLYACPKPASSEREAGLELPLRPGGSNAKGYTADVARGVDRNAPRARANWHPTTKPIKLMRWLCRLVTPRGGLVVEPFAGSGTTMLAVEREGFRCFAVEREPAYCDIARARLEAVVGSTE